ncbi:MAG TPA: hypothetical protein VN043_03700 [Rhodanobacter sp.]|nr:hypothetical protein [Rhodanobacter sp.]
MKTQADFFSRGSHACDQIIQPMQLRLIDDGCGIKPRDIQNPGALAQIASWLVAFTKVDRQRSFNPIQRGSFVTHAQWLQGGIEQCATTPVDMVHRMPHQGSKAGLGACVVKPATCMLCVQDRAEIVQQSQFRALILLQDVGQQQSRRELPARAQFQHTLQYITRGIQPFRHAVGDTEIQQYGNMVAIEAGGSIEPVNGLAGISSCQRGIRQQAHGFHMIGLAFESSLQDRLCLGLSTLAQHHASCVQIAAERCI